MYEHKCFYNTCLKPPVILIRIIPPDDSSVERLLCSEHKEFVFNNASGCKINILSVYHGPDYE